MASIGTREFRDFIDLDERLVRNSDHVDIANETLYVVHVHTLYSAHHETRLRLVLSAFNTDLATLHDSKYTIYRIKE